MFLLETNMKKLMQMVILLFLSFPVLAGPGVEINLYKRKFVIANEKIKTIYLTEPEFRKVLTKVFPDATKKSLKSADILKLIENLINNELPTPKGLEEDKVYSLVPANSGPIEDLKFDEIINSGTYKELVETYGVKAKGLEKEFEHIQFRNRRHMVLQIIKETLSDKK